MRIVVSKEVQAQAATPQTLWEKALSLLASSASATHDELSQLLNQLNQIAIAKRSTSALQIRGRSLECRGALRAAARVHRKVTPAQAVNVQGAVIAVLAAEPDSDERAQLLRELLALPASFVIPILIQIVSRHEFSQSEAQLACDILCDMVPKLSVPDAKILRTCLLCKKLHHGVSRITLSLADDERRPLGIRLLAALIRSMQDSAALNFVCGQVLDSHAPLVERLASMQVDHPRVRAAVALVAQRAPRVIDPTTGAESGDSSQVIERAKQALEGARPYIS